MASISRKERSPRTSATASMILGRFNYSGFMCERHTDKEMQKHTDIQIDRHIETDRQKEEDRQTETDGEKDRETDRQAQR